MSKSEEKNTDSSPTADNDAEANSSFDSHKKDAGVKSRKELLVVEYLEGILNNDRTVLSRAITLIESSRPDHQEKAREIIEQCLTHAGDSIRIGITGIPGVGKSTFIETLGNHVIEEGRKLAVLAIDPTSTKTGGSILGDKTRMETLATNPDAYIRPSPTSGTLGGVSRKTRETILLCEAAGYDTIFVETVGVGQSDTAVHSMVDFFLLLLLAGAGDELQGIKRGIMEMADAIAINKVDSSDKALVQKAVREYKNALHLFPEAESGWQPDVVTCSALTGKGIAEIWEMIGEYISHIRQNGFFEEKRRRQAKNWMYETIQTRLMDRFYNNPGVKKRLGEIEKKVLNGKMSSFKAAQLLLDQFGE